MMYSGDPTAVRTVRVLTALTSEYPGNFTVRFWTGETWQPHQGESRFTLVLRHPGAARAMFWPTNRLGLGEAYIFDDFDLEGDMIAFTDWLRHILLLADGYGFWSRLGLLAMLLRLPKRTNPRDTSRLGLPEGGEHDRKSIAYSYDLPCEFYRLFLDPAMQYTCAYFADPNDSLETAQQRKLDYICRKLGLAPGQRLVDYGCGWGGLIVHAAKHFGVEAVGVTLSQSQAAAAEASVRSAGLSDRVRVVLGDCREFREPNGFDKAVSVGMAEHLGTGGLPPYFARVHENLREGGVYLHHCINLRPNTPYPRWTAFARKYVFPNGGIVSVLKTLEFAAATGFEVRHVENLREHYVLTLENWVRRLDARREEARRIVGDVSYRIYRLYMAGATMGFRYGTYELQQCLLAKPKGGIVGLPLTRANWYR
jgi:cyclopropane-fatty-acyl-phospholipid synthase